MSTGDIPGKMLELWNLFPWLPYCLTDSYPGLAEIKKVEAIW